MSDTLIGDRIKSAWSRLTKPDNFFALYGRMRSGNKGVCVASKRVMVRVFWIMLVLWVVSILPIHGQSLLGFDLSNATVPVDEIHRGGPPPDGIPAIDAPRFSPVAAISYLEDDDVVLGFYHSGERRAYPFRVLIWHEIVNDTVGGQPVVIVYCPLCASATVFERKIGNQLFDFGVSGLLYNSDVLMFDRQSRSLWSQLGMEAVSGPMVGRKLAWLPSEQMTWGAWKARYPSSLVLTTETGFRRDYENLPYGSYFESPRTMFPYRKNRAALAAKDLVAGVILDGAAMAFPLQHLPDGETETAIGDRTIRVSYDRRTENLAVTSDGGDVLPSVRVYWFAWQAFYPKTQLWTPGGGE